MHSKGLLKGVFHFFVSATDRVEYSFHSVMISLSSLASFVFLRLIPLVLLMLVSASSMLFSHSKLKK